MPLTPAEVRHVTFSKPPVGELGYHEDEVDEFLDLVHAELARLGAENTSLRNQVEQLDQQLRAVPVDTGRHPGPLRSVGPVMTTIRSLISRQSAPGVDHDLQAATLLVRAQEMADQVTTEAHVEADRTLNQAQTHCAHLLSEAQARAEDMVNKARTRIETMLQDARTTAETLHRQSREKTASLEQDAAGKHAEILDALNQDKTLLKNRIDDLRGFEQEYRIQLTTYLQSLLHGLDGAGSTAPANPIHTQPDLVGSGLSARGETGQSPSSPG